MKEKKYLIGEVSRITGISKDTLRFWDKIGLIKPKFTDKRNHYRYYTYDQFWKLDIIVCCRSLDISIDTIRTILDSNSNDRVVRLLLEQQQKAEELSRYYKKVSEDIDWYAKRHDRILHTKENSDIIVKYFPKRSVLYGSNVQSTHAYHLKLQELCQTAVRKYNSIRRNYGFILDETKMQTHQFIKKGEYIWFDEPLPHAIDDKYLTFLPEGEYACCIVNVKNNMTDFTLLQSWLEQHKYTPSYVIADEIGLQLFEYLEHGYLCEVKVLLK